MPNRDGKKWNDGSGKTGEDRRSELNVFIGEAVSFGCVDVSESLGIRKMPKGYALMLNADHTHHYWLRYDGIESDIHWDKWAVYRGAKEDDEM